MDSHREVSELLENIRTELPERVRDLYEEAVRRASKQRRESGQHIARKMMERNPFLRQEVYRQQQQAGVRTIFVLIIGLVGGAALMYLFDPILGRRRRALLRDQMNKAANSTSDAVDDFSHDARNRAMGAAHEAKKRFENEAVPDENLVARVRAEMGHIVSHPGAVEVAANAGTITFSGDILSTEVPALLAKVRLIPGVRAVENHLRTHESPEAISNLRSGTPNRTTAERTG
ncbi:MAG: hypothetical protein IT319_06890 [Anaerolineae bacterium]|nr:hypothetical protein [Anaerolineae bacterium]